MIERIVRIVVGPPERLVRERRSESVKGTAASTTPPVTANTLSLSFLDTSLFDPILHTYTLYNIYIYMYELRTPLLALLCLCVGNFVQILNTPYVKFAITCYIYVYSLFSNLISIM